MPRRILVASPGTGKTTRLLSMIEDHLKTGVSPSRICFTTYTRAGADEARDRAIVRFGHSVKDYKYFKTLHALAYHELGAPKIVEGEPSFFKELFKKTGVPCTFMSRGNPMFGMTTDAPKYLGDLYLTIHNLARNSYHDPRAVALQTPQFAMVPLAGFDFFIKTYNEIKQYYRVQDFTEIIENFIRYQDIVIPVDFLFVDEAQDLTPLQWAMVRKIEEKCHESVIAGDDKQAIYEWAGAAPKDLINLAGEREILSKSYRLKDNMVAFSEKIANKIRSKSKYEINGIAAGGSIKYIHTLDSLNLAQGSWLLLARLNKDLEAFQNICEQRGYKYLTNDGGAANDLYEAIRFWEALRDGQWLPAKHISTVLKYLRTGDAVKRGAKKDFETIDPEISLNLQTLIDAHGLLRADTWDKTFAVDPASRETALRTIAKEGHNQGPRIKILTIHGSKGLEAENVVLIPRLSPSCRDTLEKNPDAEHRVFYVGATRAKDNLYILKTDDHDYQL